MSDSLVEYELRDGVAVITMDDGKANALSPALLAALGEALDRAEADRAAVVLAGRPGRFSAGFDMKVLGSVSEEAADLLQAGFHLARRLFGFPGPVVAACTGHAMAMGVFLLLAADYRVGAAGDFKIAANEVAIGMTMPRTPIVLCRARLNPSHFERVVSLAEVLDPASAVPAGFLDEIVDPGDVVETACTKAAALRQLNLPALAATKARTRKDALEAMVAATEADDRDFRALLSR